MMRAKSNYLPYTDNPTPPKSRAKGLSYDDFKDLALIDAVLLFVKLIFFATLGIIWRYRMYAGFIVAFIAGTGSIRYAYEKIVMPASPYSMAITLPAENLETPVMEADEHPPQSKKVSKSDNPPTIIKDQMITVKFIARWAATAQEEQRIYGIPASITLAQGIIESGSGTSGLSSDPKVNNFFGIKCFSKKHRRCCVKSYDNGNGDGFKMYDSPWLSWRDHSKLLTNKRYKHCWSKKRIADMAYALQEAGYAYPKKGYAEKLLNVIRTYNLERFDK
jgi:flagellum-specific peptidoglycan hydrolase FlgJ